MEYATHEELLDGPLAKSGAIITKVDKCRSNRLWPTLGCVAQLHGQDVKCGEEFYGRVVWENVPWNVWLVNNCSEWNVQGRLVRRENVWGIVFVRKYLEETSGGIFGSMQNYMLQVSIRVAVMIFCHHR